MRSALMVSSPARPSVPLRWVASTGWKTPSPELLRVVIPTPWRLTRPDSAICCAFTVSDPGPPSATAGAVTFELLSEMETWGAGGAGRAPGPARGGGAGGRGEPRGDDGERGL